MRRKLLALLITLAMVVGSYFLVITVVAHSNSGDPTAKHGQLDLSHWNFAKNGAVRLAGDWTFYPGQLIDPSSSTEAAADKTATTISVPGSWVKQMSPIGVATYRLLVKMGPTRPSVIYGIKMQSLQMASRVIINGVEVGQSGNPAKGAAYVGKNQPFVAYFPMHAGLNDIVVQVANYDLPSSAGMNLPMYLGYEHQITSLNTLALAHDFIEITLFGVMGLYFLGLYNQRRKDYSILFFSLMCLGAGVYTAFSDEKVVYDVLPGIPDWLTLQAQVLCAIGGSLLTSLYVYFAFRKHCSGILMRTIIIVGLVIVIGELTPLRAALAVIGAVILSTYIVLSLTYSTSVLVLGVMAREEGSLYLLLAAMALSFYALSSNLSLYFGIPVYTLPPIDSIVYVLMFALLMSLRFSNAFKQNELMSAQLIKADKIKDEFLSKTAHEFKTPLHGVIAIAQSMLDDTSKPLDAVQREDIHLLANMSKRLSRLVYDILDFTNLQQGELKVVPRPVDVRSVVEIMLKVYGFITRDYVLIVNSVPTHLANAFADEDRVRQILGNLLDNALKHTDSGVVEITACQNGDMVEISVVDSGSGIDERDLGIIFNPFTSLDTNSDQSFGLGLSIVRQLVELHNGRVWVESVKGKGSTFTFSLPIAVDTEKDIPKRRREDRYETSLKVVPEYSISIPYISEQKGTYTILAVDDRFSNLKILIDSLEKLEYTVVAVDSGEEGLSYLESHGGIDLVVLDLMMPGMSGLEMCQRIRAKYSLLELPVVMVTASIQEEDKLAAFRSGANDYLPKPFDFAELKARINSLLVMRESAMKATNMEIAFLQSQIKPHFLFNVLNTIMALSYTDIEKARKLTVDLSEYLRGSFSFTNVESSVMFRQELALIERYVDIEKARFKDRIQVEYEISPRTLNVKIPPLLLQPLVENAIGHGITNRIDGGIVHVRSHRQDNYTIFEIQDNGVGMTKQQLDDVLAGKVPTGKKGGVGLQNIHRRIKYLYGSDLQIESFPDRGTKVTVKILEN